MENPPEWRGPNGSRNRLVFATGVFWGHGRLFFFGRIGSRHLSFSYFSCITKGIYFYTRPCLCLGDIDVIVNAEQASMAAGEREAGPGSGRREAVFIFPS